MKIRSLNNATIHVETVDLSLLIDPWIVGALYKGAWSPRTRLKDLSFLSSINYVFISHIHEDHWDLDTLDRVPRDTKILLPNFTVNRVIEKKIKELGFSTVVFIDIGETFSLNETINIRVIPPLNSFGQEIASYEEEYEYDATSIDSSLLLTDQRSISSHLFLCDNSPYDLKKLQEEVQIELTTLWYPFNSYAQDYPICYQNISVSDKRLIHDKMHKIRVDSTVNAIERLSPKYCFPHSADFVLNGQVADTFAKYVCDDFIDRKKVAQKYGLQLSNINTRSEYAEAGDLVMVSNGDISISRDSYEYSIVKPASRLPALETEDLEDIYTALTYSFKRMLERAARFGVDVEKAKDWILSLKVDDSYISFCFSEKKLYLSKRVDWNSRKLLQINLTYKQLSALLKRDLHWNNAMIGYHLKYLRIPNEFCQEVYKALNFLHL